MSWTKEDQAKLREYQTAQMTVKEIAKKMGKPADFIRSELRSMGYGPIESKPKPEKSEFLNGAVKIERKPYARITTAVEKRVCELRESCHTTTQIAMTLNIAQQTVANILKRNGYPTGRGQYHKLTLEDVNPPEQKLDKPSQINREFEAAVNEMIAEMKEEKAVKLTDAEKEPAPVATVTDSTVEKEVLITTNDNTNAPKCQSLTGIKMMMEIEAMLGEVFGRDAELVSVSADAERCDIRFTQGGREYGINFGLVGGMPRYEEVRK